MIKLSDLLNEQDDQEKKKVNKAPVSKKSSSKSKESEKKTSSASRTEPKAAALSSTSKSKASARRADKNKKAKISKKTTQSKEKELEFPELNNLAKYHLSKLNKKGATKDFPPKTSPQLATPDLSKIEPKKPTWKNPQDDMPFANPDDVKPVSILNKPSSQIKKANPPPLPKISKSNGDIPSLSQLAQQAGDISTKDAAKTADNEDDFYTSAMKAGILNKEQPPPDFSTPTAPKQSFGTSLKNKLTSLGKDALSKFKNKKSGEAEFATSINPEEDQKSQEKPMSQWKEGDVVKIGWMGGYKVLGKDETGWILRSKNGEFYKYISPKIGLKKLR